MLGCLILLLSAAISYMLTVGLVYLIALCFGWTFSWIIATGIWLVIIILRSAFED